MVSMVSTQKRAFTLVELLVVVAIIGLLVSLSLIAIEHYRKKAQDSRITATLSQIRSVSAQIYSDENTYSSICSGGELNGSDDYPNLKTIKSETEKMNGGETPLCSGDDSKFCVSSPLVAGDTICVDSSGYIGEDLSNCQDGKCQ